MIKRLLLTLTGITLLLSAMAAEGDGNNAIFTKPKFSGFAMASYQATFQDGNNSNSFDLRLVRASIEGRILNDFSYENPMNPIDQGFMSYSQPISRLAGFSDRTGMHASNGRDIGLQFQGDFLKNSSGRNLIHYQVGVFNGQGINVKDVDERKDIIGGAWVMPIQGMRIGAFGWEGSYARKSGGQTVSLRQHRYALSAEYKKGDLQLRTEYIHSTGRGFATTYQKSADGNDATIKTYADKNGNEVANDKADGVYALAIIPVVKDKLMAKARYDLYRPTASSVAAKTNYEVGLNYRFCKYLEVQTEYCLTHDRALAKPDYSSVFVQVSIRY